MYNDLILSYFFNPEHVGKLNTNHPYCIRAHVEQMGSIWMDLFIQCNDQGRVLKTLFKACACPYRIAGLEWLCRQLVGESIYDYPRVTYNQLIDLLGLSSVNYALALQLESLYKDAIACMRAQFGDEI